MEISFAGTAAPLAGALVGLIGAVASAVLSRRTKEQELETALQTRVAFDNAIDTLASEAIRIRNVGGGAVSVDVAPGLIPEQLHEEAGRVFAEPTHRLSAIEQRLPEASTVDKIASVNEAVLATKIEGLEREIDRMRDATLSRWDVALVLFAVLGALSLLIGMLTASIKYLS